MRTINKSKTNHVILLRFASKESSDEFINKTNYSVDYITCSNEEYSNLINTNKDMETD